MLSEGSADPQFAPRRPSGARCAMFRLRAYGGLTLDRDGAPYAGPAAQRRRIAVIVMIAAS